jgi:acetyltransferase-like isoleucine patch superfamily enzyme
MKRLLFRIFNRLQHEKDVLLSTWYRAQLASCGRGAIIRRPRKIVGGRYIRAGAGFDCFAGLRIEAFDCHLGKTFTPEIVIGDKVSINYDCHIGCVNRIEIGDRVLIASRVYISDHAHGAADYSDIETPPSKRLVHSKGPVVIEDDVWIGEGACILPGVRIGRNAIVGANAVVTRDVAPFTIVGGVPARVIRKLARAGERSSSHSR